MGTVLDKTVNYLKDLVFQNEQLTASAKIAEKSINALAMLQNQIQVLDKESTFLRAQIIQFGIDAAASSGQKQPNQQLLNSPLAQSLLNTVVTHSPRPLLSPLHNSPHNKLTMQQQSNYTTIPGTEPRQQPSVDLTGREPNTKFYISHPYNNLVALSPAWHLRKHNLCTCQLAWPNYTCTIYK